MSDAVERFAAIRRAARVARVCDLDAERFSARGEFGMACLCRVESARVREAIRAALEPERIPPEPYIASDHLPYT